MIYALNTFWFLNFMIFEFYDFLTCLFLGHTHTCIAPMGIHKYRNARIVMNPVILKDFFGEFFIFFLIFRSFWKFWFFSKCAFWGSIWTFLAPFWGHFDEFSGEFFIVCLDFQTFLKKLIFFKICILGVILNIFGSFWLIFGWIF